MKVITLTIALTLVAWPALAEECLGRLDPFHQNALAMQSNIRGRDCHTLVTSHAERVDPFCNSLAVPRERLLFRLGPPFALALLRLCR